FGDAAQRVILAAAQADQAALVILAIPENDRARQAVRRIRAFNPTVQILARVHDLAWRARLMEAGATEVIQPEEEAASTLIRHPRHGGRNRGSDRRDGAAQGRPAPPLRTTPADRHAALGLRSAHRMSEMV